MLMLLLFLLIGWMGCNNDTTYERGQLGALPVEEDLVPKTKKNK